MGAPTAFERIAAWSVHVYTAMGIPLAVLCALALVQGDGSRFFFLSAFAAFVDATDGFFARRFRVKEVAPGFDGRRLDDIVDFIHFVLLPMAALPALGLLPWSQSAWVTVPILASAYGFCQDMAKTDDSFVGFPSYWNILTLYLYIFGATSGVVLASLIALSVMVFVPVHYVYPSRTKMMQRTTVGLGTLWTLMVVALCLAPEASWAVPLGVVSLFYPAYYTAISVVHHKRVMARLAAS